MGLGVSKPPPPRIVVGAQSRLTVDDVSFCACTLCKPIVVDIRILNFTIIHVLHLFLSLLFLTAYSLGRSHGWGCRPRPWRDNGRVRPRWNGPGTLPSLCGFWSATVMLHIYIFMDFFLCWVTMVTLHINMRPYACTFGVHRQPTRRLWHCLTENSMPAEGKLSPGSTERDQLLLLLLLLQLLPPAIGLFWNLPARQHCCSLMRNC